MLTTIALVGLAVCVFTLVNVWARVRDLEDMLGQAEHSLSERMRTTEREALELAESVGHLKETVEKTTASVEEIHSDMKEHDDSFERFLDGMSNVMNYSYETAMESRRPEDED